MVKSPGVLQAGGCHTGSLKSQCGVRITEIIRRYNESLLKNTFQRTEDQTVAGPPLRLSKFLRLSNCCSLRTTVTVEIQKDTASQSFF